MHEPVGSEQHRSSDHIPHFAQVAGPGVFQEQLQDLLVETGYFFAQFGVGFFQEKMGQ